MEPRSPAGMVIPQAPPFPAGSRYAQVKTATYLAPDGTAIPYLERRFCPPPGTLQTLAEEGVRDPDRMDLVAARTYGDPLQWWRIADAEAALDPRELTDRPGRRLRVPVPLTLPQP